MFSSFPQSMLRRVLPFCAALALGGLSPRLEASNDEAIAQLNLSRFVLPAYPAALRQTGVAQGNVIVALETRRTAAGPAGEFLILSATDPQFGDSVARAIAGWRFAEPKAGSPGEGAAGGPTIVRFQFVATGVVTLSVPDFQARRTAALQAEAGGNTVILPTFADLDQSPAILAQPMPAYPAALRSKPVPGTAAVRFFVDTEGRVRLPTVTSATTPEFAEAALSVLGQWRFAPPTLSGKPVIAIGTWTFNFGPAS
jgi:TonB family protein